MNLIDNNRAHYDTLVLGFLKDRYNLVPQDSACLTDCEPVREANRYAVAELKKSEAISLHTFGMASAIAAGPK